MTCLWELFKQNALDSQVGDAIPCVHNGKEELDLTVTGDSIAVRIVSVTKGLILEYFTT